MRRPSSLASAGFFPGAGNIPILKNRIVLFGLGLKRRRALFIPADALVGMVGAAFAFNEERVAVTFLVSFLGLLRAGELLALTPRQMRTIGNKVCVIALPESKGFKEKASTSAS